MWVVGLVYGQALNAAFCHGRQLIKGSCIKMAKIDLTQYGITGTTEIVYNPSYEMLFEEETKPGLEG